MKPNKTNVSKRDKKKELPSTIQNLPATIIEYLKKSNNCDTYKTLADRLKVKESDIRNFKSGQSCGKPAVKKLIDAVVNHSVRKTYQPIIELQPIEIDSNRNMLIGNSEDESEQWQKN
jgi:predicted transcriptional regulator